MMMTRSFTLFSFLYTSLAYLLVAPILFLCALLPGKRFKAFRFRLRTCFKLSPPPAGSETVWLHGSSVGEVKIATRMAGLLKKDDRVIYLSVFTRTGYSEAKKEGVFTDVFLLPPDIPFCMKSIVQKIHPRLLVVIESDFWLSMIREVKLNGGKVVLVNGRMSEKATRNHLRFPYYLKEILSYFDRCLMRSKLDAERIRFFCTSEKIEITGNIKFDMLPQPNERKHFFDKVNGRFITLASTRDGEEELLLNAFQKSETRRLFKEKQVRILLAPRHISRIREVEELLHRKSIPYARLSTLEVASEKREEKGYEIILIDRLGVLSACYQHSFAAFIGGSLVSKGGQNLLEAISASLPICFGNDMANFHEEAGYFEKLGAKRCNSADEVFAHFLLWINEPAKAVNLGKELYAALQKKRHVSKQYAEAFEKLLR